MNPIEGYVERRAEVRGASRESLSGYRAATDKYAKLKNVRFPKSDVLVEV